MRSRESIVVRGSWRGFNDNPCRDGRGGDDGKPHRRRNAKPTGERGSAGGSMARELRAGDGVDESTAQMTLDRLLPSVGLLAVEACLLQSRG